MTVLRGLAFSFGVSVMMGAAGQVIAQSGADERWPAPPRVDITLVGPETALAPVRDVTTDLLSRDGIRLTWRNAAVLRAEDVIDAPYAGRGALIVVWVDVTAATEARIYFRAAAGRRFVIRRVSLPDGMGPLVVEEIAQIVQSVLRALAADTAWALSLSEARAALNVPEPRPMPVIVVPARATAVELGIALVGQSYASELPFAGDMEIAVAAMSRATPSSPPAAGGALGGRLVLGYGMPAHFTSGDLGADLRTAKLRLGLLWEPWRRGNAAIRLGVSGGVDRVEYTPTVEVPGAMVAAGDTFVTPLACPDVALRFDVSARLALTAAVLAEIALARVHFDAYDAGGNRHEILVPHRVRPGIAIGVEVRL